ncbi:MAG TPA: amidohydrolase family protein [Vicinamibacterales bacterium]|nr:amidohydrolase family protein [Vicinamibacterales bacterium]
MSWEQAIRKSSWLPASTIGMSDRGLLARGMAADVVVFDPNTIIDRATYENPALMSEGVKVVLVNGVVALQDGVATGARGGHALRRTMQMPSRRASADLRSVSVKSHNQGHSVAISLTQGAGVREAKGVLSIDGVSYQPGFLQTAPGWASVSGSDGTRTIVVTVDVNDPANGRVATVTVTTDGQPPWQMRPLGVISIKGGDD